MSDYINVGSYTLMEVLGRGATGAVWRARTAAGEDVAFKLLRPELADEPRVVHGFIAERSLLQRARGQYVTQVRDLVAEGGQLGIVMELVPGGSVRQLLERVGTLAPTAVCDLGGKIAEGLATLHQVGVVHRDVKPENVLLAVPHAPWQPRITDFGISKVLDHASTAGRGTAIVGTPAYISPEVLDGQVASGASDVYALGVMLYEFLCGVTPFADPNSMVVLRRQLDHRPGRPDGIDDRLWQVVARCLEEAPDARPTARGVGERLAALAPALTGSPALAALTLPPDGDPVAAPPGGTVVVQREAPTIGASNANVAAPRPPVVGTVQPPAHSSRAALVALATAATVGMAAVIGGGVWAWSKLGNTTDQAAPTAPVTVVVPSSSTSSVMSSRPPVTTVTTPATASPTPSVTVLRAPLPAVTSMSMSEEEAQANLVQARNNSLASVQLVGNWDAGISAQWVGISDPNIQDSPFTAADIYRLYVGFRNDPRFSGPGVVLLKQGDFGKADAGSHETWVTLANLQLPTKEAAQAWCEQTFAMSKEEVGNYCIPRQMTPHP